MQESERNPPERPDAPDTGYIGRRVGGLERESVIARSVISLVGAAPVAVRLRQ